jgi:hypothetical protein
VTAIRLSPAMRQTLDTWAARQPDNPSRSESIRRLVELGFSASHSARPHSAQTRAKAADLAAEAIDRHTDQSAPPEEQASRKRKLLKGPKEFRDIRKDHK